MYAGSPHLFNVPEITTLRRVKPLPKRRRTSAPVSSPLGSMVPAIPSPLSAAAAAAAAAVVASSGGLLGDPELEAAANALLVPPPHLLGVQRPLSGSSSPLSTLTLTSVTHGNNNIHNNINNNNNNNNINNNNNDNSNNNNNNHHGVVLDPPSDTFGLSNLPPLPPLPGLAADTSGDTTAEEILAHADTLSARMALQSYYMPMLGSMHEFLAAAAASAGISAGEMFKDRLGVQGTSGGASAGAGMGYVDLDPGVASVEFMYGAAGGVGYPCHGMNGLGGIPGMGMGMGLGTGMGRDEEEDGQGDGDYIDHLQQPGNTKKRKVPANASVTQREDVESVDHMQEEGEERVVEDESETSSVERSASGGVGYQHPHPYPMSPHASLVPTMYHGWRRGKLTAATLAGLQHKELLKTRKRQLAAVLGALSHGDTLALDQALSVNYPSEEVKKLGSDPPRVRLSKRRAVRMARMARKEKGKRRKTKFPVGEFTFVCPSATADRLIATKEEVAMLRHRFEEELARQAAKAQQLAVAAAAAVAATELSLPRSTAATGTTTAKGSKGKKSPPKVTKGVVVAGEPTMSVADSPVDSQAVPTAKARGRKKKRSTLANASNPHHLRNYVPSRLPSSGQHGMPQQNWVSPLAVRFLTAEIPARRKAKNGEPVEPPTTQVPLTSPGEEWICAFCEYDLFYGDDVRFRRAVRNRKKILRRRRRARERAAAAASGKTNVGATSGNGGPSGVPGVSGDLGSSGGYEEGVHVGGMGMGRIT
ncbi:hypothetical protein APHAL10511_005730 [Amanita phalloides]|nr:hypothetical protein APHAL10511_005730 [Amanita phalloides]